jgi:hypothetical protein
MSEFTESEKRTLSALVEAIIPASDEYAVPGASDPSIFADILSDSAPHHATIARALSALDALAQQEHSAAFADLDGAARDGVAEAFRSAHAADALLIANLTAQGYYRDDRVMLSIGMEPRPPYPQGYEVAQGDWSLLDPVKKFSEIYRKAH